MSSGTGPILFSLCTTIGFDLSFSKKSWHFCASTAVSGSTGYFATEAETQVDAEFEVEVEIGVGVEAEVDGRSSEGRGGGTFSGGCWERWMDGMTCIGAEWVTTLATAVRSTSRSSSGGISSNLQIDRSSANQPIVQRSVAQSNQVKRVTHRSTRATMYPSMILRSMTLNRYAPCVATTLRPSASICTLRMSSIVPNSLRKPPSAWGEMTIPKRGVFICKQRRSMSRYLGNNGKLSNLNCIGSLPRLEDVEVGGEAWKGELEYEDGGVESWVPLLSIDDFYSFFESIRV
jgi:hypothetical protein